ncbi:MAG: response regulator transcription factor [Bacteroidales bacterium]|nr:response regulator transcription factor [Bacteroidales bacterium]
MDEAVKVNVMLAEDDDNLGLLLREYLQSKGYQTDLYRDGAAALEGFLKFKKYDICILDVMMPIKDGFSLAKDIKQKSPFTPILFLTAKSMKEDVLEGFSVGADDYVIKPFNVEELVMRIEAILRRTRKHIEHNQPAEIKIGRYVFNHVKQTLELDGKQQKLTAKESELLRFLVLNKNNLLDRNTALNTIWNGENYFNARSMDVYITKLRKYLKDDPSVEIINVRGRGFKLLY